MSTNQDLMGLGMPAPLARSLSLTPEAVTAAGTAVATATGMHTTASFINVTTASSQDGIKFNNSWALGKPCIIFNPNSTAANVYPPTGANWNGGSTDATITIAQNKCRIFIRYSTTLCVSFLTA